MRAALLGISLALVVAGCTTDPQPELPTSPVPSVSTGVPSAEPDAQPTSEPTAAPTAEPAPAGFSSGAAMRDVRALAGDIGPRLATGAAYREAGRFVQRRFRGLGYDVRRESFPVPAGDSWGVPVRAGRSFNVVAEPAGFDRTRPHVLVGAHLDTVAVAPGAEDNASGVAVLLEVARLAAAEDTGLPVVLVAFGAEEPRGPGDDLHHFGSQHYVEQMTPRQAAALQAMVSLDRVGVGDAVPVCTGPISPARVQRQLLELGRRIDVPTVVCENTASDHWSFEKAGYAVARLGSTSYAEYHSPADLPRVVDQRQLSRTGRLVWAWLRQPR